MPAGVLRDAPAQAGKRLAGPEAVCFFGSPRPPGRGSRGEAVGLRLVELTFNRVCVGNSQST